MGRPEDDALAETAAESQPRAEPRGELAGTLGRYKLLHPLGVGGMGAVYAAFDPKLERRVALKVLRGDQTPDARERLLREARAMARLKHPNVLTVHEVDTASERDYIAMELIEGGTIDDWLRAERRSEHDVIAAFTAAGRGLAAAHAAGLVHRDFKPRNVLRHSDGRVVVTDFGLVVGLDAVARVSRPVIGKDAQSSLSGLTETGSVLGTPAYMAPEQWSGANVGPAADQFAFCVALWEALAGERPYRGDTIEQLQAALDRGPSAIDDAKVPRRYRAILKRGLESEPRDRWPSMEALLDELRPRRRRPLIAIAIAASAVVAAAVAFVLVARHDEPARTCELPPVDPAQVWSPQKAAALAPAHRADIRMIDNTLRTWHEARQRTCSLPSTNPERAMRLACLDGALVKVDLVARALAAAGTKRRTDAGLALIDPLACERAKPPRLERTLSPERIDVLARSLRSGEPEVVFDEAAANELIARAGTEPCAMVTARLAAMNTRTAKAARDADVAEAARQAQRCGDDQLIAHVAFADARWAMYDSALDQDVRDKRARAEAAAEAVPQLQAEMEMLSAVEADRAGLADEAIAHEDRAIKLFAARGLVARELWTASDRLRILRTRGTAADLAGYEPALRGLRDRAAIELGTDDPLTVRLEQTLAGWEFSLGDVEASHARLAKLHKPEPAADAIKVSGRVVDASGAPVAGATVGTGTSLKGDSVSATMPDGDTITTTTAADGSFTFTAAPRDGAIIAEKGSERSAPLTIRDGLTLTLAPTSELHGTVDLRGQPAPSVVLIARTLEQSYMLPYWGVVAPVRADGSFVIGGAPRGKISVHVIINIDSFEVMDAIELVASEPVVRGLRVTVPHSTRVVHGVVRSTAGTPLGTPQVFALPGKVASSTLRALGWLTVVTERWGQAVDAAAPAVVKARAKPGDFYATMKGVPAGTISICAIGWPPNVSDSALMRVLIALENQERVTLSCVTLGANDEVAVISVPPWPRFD